MRPGELALAALAAALLLATALRLPAAWESGNALSHVSGAWMTLADDLARGTFYRPLHDPAHGYGGTRFFPLAFALHAGLLRAGAGLLAAGLALCAAAGALLLLGVFLLARRFGLALALAGAVAALALAGFAGQLGLASVRGDLLPVALSALGLAALAGPATARRVAAATALLALAFAAKPTALTAAAAGVAWLLARRERRAAAALAAGVGALAVGVVLATDALSGGRFLAVLAAGASGGADLAHVVRAPVRLANYLAVGDPAGLVLLSGGLVAVLASTPALLRAVRTGGEQPPLLLAALWLAAACAGALVVFASPGTGVNHLVEAEVAAAVALGAALATPGRAATLARVAAPLAAAAGLAFVLFTWRADASGSRLAEIRAVAAALPPGAVLSEDPLVPLLAGRRPVILDAWMLRLAASREPALTRDLSSALARGDYAAVVLFEDLDAPGADAWYAGRNLGLPLVGAIRAGYRRATGIGRYHLYVPRAARDLPGEAPRVTAADGSMHVVPRAAAR